jgi:hypothetical protein
MEPEENSNNGFTDKELIKWGVVVFLIIVYGFLYLKLLFIA